MPIRIQHVDSNFEREPLAHPFGFKGGYLTELWQTVALMEGASGRAAVGLGTQSVLWADSSVFAAHTESGGNALMFALTERALQIAEGTSFETPIDLIEGLVDELLPYARTLTGNPELQKTFVLNALVPVDHAAWLLYAKENGIQDFDAMIPAPYRPGLSHRHDRVASIPAFGYDAPLDDIEAAADAGYYFMKIKIGQPGTQAEMLAKDKARLAAIHSVLGDRQTPYTESGRIPYYLDANGRYAAKDTLRRLLDHADRIGALEQIVIVEEPFQANVEGDVSGFPVRIAADESAHTGEETRRVIQQGYEAIALKPIAKTLSMTMQMAQVAYEHDVPCFCADLTVNPILVDWNKNVAARLPPLPGFRTGLMETNGHQNYAHWEQLTSYHPHTGAPWTKTQEGVFRLGEDFYATSGGIFATPEHYRNLVRASSE
jgi:L-alanine-DL-glutamate epimerase-like enolase superfamily enzyme